MNQLWSLFFLAVLCPLKAPAQDTSAGIRTDGFYAYSWQGKDVRIERHGNCDSITSPDVFFYWLPLFFFYKDSTIVVTHDYDFKTATDAPLTPAYFQQYQTRLSTDLRNKAGQQSGANFGMYHRHGNTVIAKMRYSEYRWDKFPAYYHLLVKSPDTLLLTEFDCSFCVYCAATVALKLPVIKFDPPVLFTFYPFPVKPDSSWAGFNKRTWARKP